MANKSGWYKESKRHSLAARGIKTSMNRYTTLSEKDISNDIVINNAKKAGISLFGPTLRFTEDPEIHEISYIDYLKYCRDGFDEPYFEDLVESMNNNEDPPGIGTDFSYFFNLDGTGSDTATQGSLDRMFQDIKNGKLRRYNGKLYMYDAESDKIWIIDFPYNNKEELMNDVRSII